MTKPKRLYKFSPLNVYSLRAIAEAEVFHQEPRLFNDPLDCSPTLEIDRDNDDLERLLRAMLHETMKKPDVEEQMDAVFNNASQPNGDEALSDKEFLASHKWHLADQILKRMGRKLGTKGVLSLSESWSEPLMWSHYADQHKGISIEYDTTKWDVPQLKKVNYNASRAVRANDLYRWLVDRDQDAKERVYATYYYSKAPEWSYEKEWRDVSDRSGVNNSSFDMTAIYFGIRMDFVWKRTLTKLLNQNPAVKLYQVSADKDSFELRRQELNREEFQHLGIQEPAFKIFGNFIDSTIPDDGMAEFSKLIG